MKDKRRELRRGESIIAPKGRLRLAVLNSPIKDGYSPEAFDEFWEEFVEQMHECMGDCYQHYVPMILYMQKSSPCEVKGNSAPLLDILQWIALALSVTALIVSLFL